MGKKWDYDVPSTEIWSECIRVLKPGGYLLAFAGTRTQHRMAVRIEDAGFEIRDMIAWLYGSGFPKSLNIGKAVDKLQGNEREVVGTREVPDITGDAYGTMNEKQGGSYQAKTIQDTKGTSEWEGWGTALKPALEPITVARKPIEGTVAENCLKWGVGGINIDGSRVGTEGGGAHCNNRDENGKCLGHNDINDKYGETIHTDGKQGGRFPANLIHDGSEEVINLFPNTKSGDNKSTHIVKAQIPTTMSGKVYEHNLKDRKGDSGSAARFFYCAKASKSERGNDNKHPTVKPIALMEYLVKLITKPNHIVIDPFTGSGSTLIACKQLGRRYVGIERESEYIKIAEARLSAIKATLF